MTLTAITEDLSILNPSVMIENGISRTLVMNQAKQAQATGLYCPHCYARLGKLFGVRYRNSESRRVHFYHPKYEESLHECKNYSSESEKHLAAKSYIRDQLLAQGLSDVKLEVQLQIDPGLPWRRPDILVTHPNGAIEAHEVQISPITINDLRDRTDDLRGHGCSRVVWYFHGKAYSLTNREWAEINAVECFHLWFEDSDIAKPRIKKAEPAQEKPLSKKRINTCDTRSSAGRTGVNLDARRLEEKAAARREAFVNNSGIQLNTPYRTTYEKGHKLFEQFNGWVLTPIAFVRGGAFCNCNAVKGEGGMAERRCFADVPVGVLVRAKY